MKKNLTVVILMLLTMFIFENVYASELNDFNECQTVLSADAQKKITTCNYGFENTSDEVHENFPFEMKFIPAHENTTVELNWNEEYVTVLGDTNDGYASLEIGDIPAKTKATFVEIVWTADATLSDNQAGGQIYSRIPSSTESFDDVPSSSSTDAKVVEMNETSPYFVFVSWGAFEYTYNNRGDGSYFWEPASENSNVVMVENAGGIAVNAEISWEATIPNVEASYVTKYSDSSNVKCVVEDGILPSNTFTWNDGKYTSDGYTEKFYTGSSCENEVSIGTSYEPNKYYHLEIVDEHSNDTSVTLNQLVPIDYSSFVSRVYWTVGLTGGSYDDVVTAVNGDKKIGSVTVTLSAAELGDIG